MVDTNNIFGFELFQEIYNKQITKKEDLLILFIHWYLIKQGFRCIGIGDSVSYYRTFVFINYCAIIEFCMIIFQHNLFV